RRGRAHERVDGTAARGERRPRSAVHALRPGRTWARLPYLDDPRRGSLPALLPGDRSGVVPAGCQQILRSRARRGEGRGDLRDGDDGEAGRFRRAREHDGGVAGRGRHVDAHGPQVVLLRADVRCVPRARAGTGGIELFPRAAGPSGGERNPFAIQRLKNKLGNRSNASGEVEFSGTTGWLVGEEGRGVRAIIEMVARTRLDHVFGAAAGMRQALAEALWHARHRKVFGARLIDQPAMAGVLADLALESEAATATAMRLARAHDEDAPDTDAAFRRL